ncbi:MULTISPECIES: excinuclease ABC subunit A [unclassified Campylobacter]|uniref:excinuclease ABC subunit A n=1 Tax=unclassified Campylobacter TaxID=2593542 RepID=UPI0022E9F8BA|nr:MULTISPECIES: excinuclease ABC subunit A [unclassified Campylobacter]MDA3043344.1 excinuclease ABC subunit A [Campylobacter sp. JMF_09 ED2]MDA3044967.1 excinuclease ABC subunit A [Campylobacter sp. JMF_07 ED4]MDA3064433.1 excinuclease ABC subunit A [Campylobacter sp. JMF_11 EL3]MDA3071750.1 excinuclease ABC subunit A [Campylobacter sp. VBCF_03 NA9]MDA3075317.1 excinuclease ABC subunit A [Campylobacter sp. JMF_05 ED3]
MKKFLSVVAALAVCANFAFAKNDVKKFSISKALSDPAVKSVLDPSVQLSFGKKGGGKKITGLISSNKKANKVGKSEEEACFRAFASAMISFQERAKREGGNKAVNLSSYYYKHEFVSDKEFECGIGNIMVGVTFRGYIAK